MSHVPTGLLPAPVTPYREDGSIDRAAQERLLAELAAHPAVTGVLMHGHTGEVLALTPEEREEGVRLARQVLGPGKTVLAGLHEQSTRAAIQAVEAAQRAGADAAMVFSPFAFGRGAMEFAPAVLTFYQEVGRVGLPFLFMQYPAATGMRMPLPLLQEVASLDGVVGVKEAVGDIGAYEEEWRALKSLPRPISVLTASEGALFSTLTVGADGALVGFGNFPELIAPLMDAVERGDLTAARAANHRLRPMQRAIYRHPSFRWSARLKYALWAQGRIPTPAVRGPLLPATEEERRIIDAALAGLKATAALGEAAS